MKPEERIASEFLAKRFSKMPVYEPLGQSTAPDFSISGTAVERCFSSEPQNTLDFAGAQTTHHGCHVYKGYPNSAVCWDRADFVLRPADCELACAMRPAILRSSSGNLRLFFLALAIVSPMDCFRAQSKSVSLNVSRPALHEKRESPLDLEVAGNLVGVPDGSTRYVRREDLLALPQVSYTVRDPPTLTSSAQRRSQ
jgi:hypothetical protein